MTVNISAPQISLPSVGLRASIGAGVIYEGLEKMPLPTNGERWNMPEGWDFQIPPCSSQETNYADSCDTDEVMVTGDIDRPVTVSGNSFLTNQRIKCSTLGTEVNVRGENGQINVPLFEKWIETQFEEQIFNTIGAELWSGTKTRKAAVTDSKVPYEKNRYLTRDDVATYGSAFSELAGGLAVSLTEGFALINKYLASCAPEQGGLVHVPVEILDYAAQKNLLIADGYKRMTWAGHTVVAQSGYAGTGPGDLTTGPAAVAAGIYWIYATGPLLVRAAIQDQFVDAIDALNNNVYSTLTGAFMFGWGCCHAGVQIDVDLP